MGLFGLFGRKADPPGTRYILDGGAVIGAPYRVKRVLPDQDDGNPALKTVGPAFTSEVEAGKYRDSLMGGAPYVYPIGAA
jgi:hypothetical protein